MKKRKLLITILITIVVLSGCTNAKIVYEVDKNHNVILDYQAEIDLSMADQDLRKGVTNLVERTVAHYENMGFTTNLEVTETLIEFDMTLIKPNDSYQQAYETLKTIMLDPSISFLLQVDLAYQIEEYEHSLDLSFDTDLALILEAAGFNAMPLKIRENLIQQLNKSNLSIEIILPYSTVIKKNDEMIIWEKDKKTHVSLPVKIDEHSYFSMISRMSIDNDKVLSMDINSSIIKSYHQIETYKMITYLAIGIGSIGLITMIIYIVKTRRQ